jgi:hypothetical protein
VVLVLNVTMVPQGCQLMLTALLTAVVPPGEKLQMGFAAYCPAIWITTVVPVGTTSKLPSFPVTLPLLQPEIQVGMLFTWLHSPVANELPEQ